MDKESFKRLTVITVLRKAIFHWFLPAIFLFIFQSCELEPNLPENVVEAQILNNNGLIYNYSVHRVEISIGQSPISIPNIYGYSRFENINTPYDLEAVMYYYNFIRKTCVFHKLKNENPRIILPPVEINNIYESRYNICYLQVNYPPILQDKIGIVKFISNDLFIQEEKILQSGEHSVFIELKIPIDKTSINGKIIFLEGEYYTNMEQQIWNTFDNFGMKDAEANTNRTDTVTFSGQDIQYNPDESSVDFSVKYPSGVAPYGSLSIALSFPGYNPNSDITIYKNYQPLEGISYTQTVPASLSIPYNVKVKSSYEFYYYTSYTDMMKIAIVQPGSSVKIVHSKLELLSPVNNGAGITMDSCLKAGDGEEKGIYLFNIENYKGKLIVIITDKNALRIGDIFSRIFKIESNKPYRWGVQKIYGYNSIDDFTNRPYIFDEKFQIVTGSELWYFTTAP